MRVGVLDFEDWVRHKPSGAVGRVLNWVEEGNSTTEVLVDFGFDELNCDASDLEIVRKPRKPGDPHGGF